MKEMILEPHLMNPIGQKIAKKIEDEGLKIQWIAKECHLSRHSISNLMYEDKPNPRLSTLIALSKVLKISLNNLLEGVEEN